MFRGAAPAPAPYSHHTHGAPAAPTGVALHPTKGSHAYPDRLNFYRVPPMREVTTEQFEIWAMDRLRVLAEVEASHARNRSPAELKVLLDAQCKKYLPLHSNSASGESFNLTAEREKDHVSHFVLRLAFCRSEDLRQRFVKAETVLFRYRFESDDMAERKAFMNKQNFDWQTVTEEEKQQYQKELLAVSPRLLPTFNKESFFKVPWTKVPYLVERRRVFLKQGTAWVPMSEQMSLVVAEFQQKLMKDLEMTARALPRLDEDDRLLPVLSNLSMGFLAGVTNDAFETSIVGEGETIKAGHVEGLIKKHAPMCMRNVHDVLRETKHLKHHARIQYSRFLKELGLPLEEALIFWRSAMTLKADAFDKEYKYNIRHTYGQEGSKINYRGMKCQDIIMNEPGTQDAHGCPFKHFSGPNLQAALATKYRLSPSEQAEVLAPIKAKGSPHYHVACTKLFEITHRAQGVRKGDGLGSGESVSHPNRYFERSFVLEKEQEGGGLVAKLEEGDGDVEMKMEDEEGGAKKSGEEDEMEEEEDDLGDFDHLDPAPQIVQPDT